jgi:hypothetical protein
VGIGHNIQHNDVDKDDHHDDNDGSDTPGPTVLTTVELTKTIGKSLINYFK